MSQFPHDTILISIPYPVKFLTIKRKIGFTFTNLYKYLLWEANDKKSMDQLKKEKSESAILSECLYFAAVAYCQLNKTKENFTKEGLKKAIALTSTADQERILKVWRESETFGATIEQSKKKVK